MKVEKLGNIAKITSGGTPLTSRREYYDNGTIPWVKTGDLKVRHLKNIPEKITQAGLENSSAKIFPVNTVLVAMYGATIGACSILKTEAATNQACAAILPNEKINEEYLYFFLLSIRKLLINKGVGGGQPNISATILKDIKVPVPSLSSQIQIATLLSKAEDLIDQRKESSELLDKFLQSTFFEMFGDPVSNEMGWEKVTLSKLGSLDRGVSKNRPRNSPELLGGKYPLIQTGEVSNSGLYITSYTQTYSEVGLKQSKLWEKGTMLITIAANIAQTSILTFDACFPDSIVGFITDEKEANTIYVHYLFSFFQEILEKNAPQAAQKNINLALLRGLPVPKPPLPLQNEFALIVDKAEALKKDFCESLHELQNLFASLNQRAFKGELKFKSIPQKEIGDPLEGMDLTKDKLPGLDDILKHAGEIAEVISEEKKKDPPKGKSIISPPVENTSIVTDSISNYKPVLEDVEPFIQRTFRDNYFSFENLKQATVKAGWQYDFETLKNLVFELLRQGKLKQIFADATFKSLFKEADADFKKIKELNEQMYLQQAATL